MNLLSRREVLSRVLSASAAAATGAVALHAYADAPARLLNLTPRALDVTSDGVCTLTCAQTLGPCHYDPIITRRDVTEGKSGLPMLLSFLVVDATTCKPVEGASVEIWHTDPNGVYSAPISTMCNPNDPVARSQTFLRGLQTAGSDGWVYFNSLYPGWYSGRTPHIHATIRRGASEMVTTQFYFPDDLNDWVYRNHPSYTHRPNRDTTNTRDNVIGGNASRVTPYLFQPKLIDGKALVAVKVIAIRSTRTTCSA